jgi:hypothetical protein
MKCTFFIISVDRLAVVVVVVGDDDDDVKA